MDEYELATCDFNKLNNADENQMKIYQIPTNLILYRATNSNIKDNQIIYGSDKNFIFVGDLNCATIYFSNNKGYHGKIIAFKPIQQLKLLDIKDADVQKGT